jgi:hypothetical protein
MYALMQLRLRFARRDQLATGLAPAGVRPCWAHKNKPRPFSGPGLIEGLIYQINDYMRTHRGR